MPTATRTLEPTLAEAPALLALVAAACRREARARDGDELHRARASGGYDVLRPGERLAEIGGAVADAASDLAGTMARLTGDDDDREEEPARAFVGFSPAGRGGTLADVQGTLVARSIQALIRLDRDMPARLRARLVAYAGLLLDGRSRAALTPAGLAALAAHAAEAAEAAHA